MTYHEYTLFFLFLINTCTVIWLFCVDNKRVRAARVSVFDPKRKNQCTVSVGLPCSSARLRRSLDDSASIRRMRSASDSSCWIFSWFSNRFIPKSPAPSADDAGIFPTIIQKRSISKMQLVNDRLIRNTKRPRESNKRSAVAEAAAQFLTNSLCLQCRHKKPSKEI